MRTTPPPSAHLIPVVDYPAVARNAGIRETDRTLVNTGRLARVTIGRRVYYPLAEVMRAAPGGYPLITSRRRDLADQPSTVTVERVDPATAHTWRHTHRPGGLVGTLAVVERHHGLLAKVHRVGLTSAAVAEAEAEAARYAALNGETHG